METSVEPTLDRNADTENSLCHRCGLVHSVAQCHRGVVPLNCLNIWHFWCRMPEARHGNFSPQRHNLLVNYKHDDLFFGNITES